MLSAPYSQNCPLRSMAGRAMVRPARQSMPRQPPYFLHPMTLQMFAIWLTWQDYWISFFVPLIIIYNKNITDSDAANASPLEQASITKQKKPKSSQPPIEASSHNATSSISPAKVSSKNHQDVQNIPGPLETSSKSVSAFPRFVSIHS